MKFNNALDYLISGKTFKLPEEERHWFWDPDQSTLKIVEANGEAMDFRELKDVETLLRTLCRTDWECTEGDIDESIDYVPENPEALKRGDTGPAVKDMQQDLNQVGYNLTVDGIYGPGSERAVRAFQKRLGLVADGVYGIKTQKAVAGEPFPESLQDSDIEWAARELDCEKAAVLAVSEVESRGRGFFTNGKPAILFERHWMRRRLKHYGFDYTGFMERMPDIVSASTGGYIGGIAEHDRLERAAKIHRDSAYESASWGAYQIMGFHWRTLGYESPTDYVENMHKNEGEHLKAFVRFIQNDTRLHKAIKTLDWTTFARIYNGPAYDKHNPPYDVRMEEAYTRHSEALS